MVIPSHPYTVWLVRARGGREAPDEGVRAHEGVGARDADRWSTAVSHARRWPRAGRRRACRGDALGVRHAVSPSLRCACLSAAGARLRSPLGFGIGDWGLKEERPKRERERERERRERQAAAGEEIEPTRGARTQSTTT